MKKGHLKGARAASRKQMTAELLLAWYDVNRRDAAVARPSQAKPSIPSGLALRDHAAADDGRRGCALLRGVPGTLARGEGLAAADPGRGVRAVGGPRLLLAAPATCIGRRRRSLREHGGVIPESADALRALPGIGPYTAAAVAAIASASASPQWTAMPSGWSRDCTRWRSRCRRRGRASPRWGRDLSRTGAPGDFAQALMDLGSTMCSPKRPRCGSVPSTRNAKRGGWAMAEELPRKPPERARPLKRGAAFVARDGQGAVYLVRRPEEGLLGGMLQPPQGNWAQPSRSKAPR